MLLFLVKLPPFITYHLKIYWGTEMLCPAWAMVALEYTARWVPPLCPSPSISGYTIMFLGRIYVFMQHWSMLCTHTCALRVLCTLVPPRKGQGWKCNTLEGVIHLPLGCQPFWSEQNQVKSTHSWTWAPISLSLPPQLCWYEQLVLLTVRNIVLY